MADEEIIERAVVAGAAHALKYKDEHPMASESEIMKHIVRELKRIVKEIDK